MTLIVRRTIKTCDNDDDVSRGEETKGGRHAASAAAALRTI